MERVHVIAFWSEGLVQPCGPFVIQSSHCGWIRIYRAAATAFDTFNTLHDFYSIRERFFNQSCTFTPWPVLRTLIITKMFTAETTTASTGIVSVSSNAVFFCLPVELIAAFAARFATSTHKIIQILN